MFGGIRALQDGEHVGLELHAWLLPPGLQPWRRLLVDIIVCAYLVAFALALWQQADRSIAIWENTGSAWRAPIPVIIKTAMAAATVLFAAEAFGNCIRSLRAALGAARA
jgi:TRAP-type C4-dicarboxylate transport system permease small subunit